MHATSIPAARSTNTPNSFDRYQQHPARNKEKETVLNQETWIGANSYSNKNCCYIDFRSENTLVKISSYSRPLPENESFKNVTMAALKGSYC